MKKLRRENGEIVWSRLVRTGWIATVDTHGVLILMGIIAQAERRKMTKRPRSDRVGTTRGGDENYLVITNLIDARRRAVFNGTLTVSTPRMTFQKPIAGSKMTTASPGSGSRSGWKAQ